MNALPITASFVFAINIIIVTVRSHINPSSVCGPHTTQILVIKNGIICGTIAEQPSLRHLSIDPQIVPKLLTNSIPLPIIEDPNDSHYNSEQIDRRPDTIEEGIAKYHRLLFEKISGAKKFSKQLQHPTHHTRTDLRAIDHQLYDNKNHYNHNKNSIIGDNNQSEDHHNRKQLLLSHKYNDNNANLALIENFVNSLQQQLNTEPTISQTDNSNAGNDNLQSVAYNHYSEDNNNNNDDNNDGHVDSSSSVANANYAYESLRQNKALLYPFSDNNRQGVIHRLIKGFNGKAGAFGTRLRNPSGLNYHHQSSSIHEPELMSGSQFHHHVVVHETSSPPPIAKFNFGFPKYALQRKPQLSKDMDMVYGEHKVVVPDLLYGFKPLGGEDVKPPQQQMKQSSDSSDEWTTVRHGLKYKPLLTVGSSLPVSEEFYKDLDEIAKPVTHFQPRKYEQNLSPNYYYTVNSNDYENNALKPSQVETNLVFSNDYETNGKNNIDLYSSASDKYLFTSEPKDFYLDKSRIEYDGWKPINRNRADKSIKRMDDVDQDLEHPATVVYSLITEYYNTTNSSDNS